MASEGYDMTHISPPRIAEALLRLTLPPHERDTVSGDLLEEYRECVYPERGRVRANLWYVGQILGFLHWDTRLSAALLGAATIARTALDWRVPTVDFHTRASVSTAIAAGLLCSAGFSASWRSQSPWTGAFAGVVSSATAAGVSVAGTIVLFIRYRDPVTLAAIQRSGGLPEALTLPVLLILPGLCLAGVGGIAGWLVRGFVRARSSRS